jgi:FixJ family two-component response regulator
MPHPRTQVYIIDGSPSLCSAYARVVRSANMEPQTFASVEDFMRSGFSDDNACVISDAEMPGTSGIDLPGLLQRAGHRLPVIIVTGHDAPEMRDRARREGAAAYFRKPIDDHALLDAIVWSVVCGKRQGT